MINEMTKKNIKYISNLLIYIGLSIIILWCVAVVVFPNHDLRSNTLLLVPPIAIGSLLFSLGIGAKVKNILLKILLIIFNTIFFIYFTYWILFVVLVWQSSLAQ